MKLIKINVFIILIILFISCSIKNSPENTLKKYLYSLKKEKFKVSYDLLCKDDRREVSLEDFTGLQDASPVAKYINKNVEYKILDTSYSETGNTVFINVEVKRIDLVALYHIIPELLNDKLTYKEVKKIFDKNYRAVNNNRIKNKILYNLILENGAWFIKADYGRQKTADRLLKEADKYYANDNYVEALKKYEEVLDFNNDEIEAVKGINKINEKLNYINNFIELKYFVLHENNENTLSINIINNGTIRIKKIKIGIIYYDKNGKKIFNDAITSEIEPLGYKDQKTMGKKISIKNYSDIQCKILAIDF